MKKFMNTIDTMLRESLAGFSRCHANIVQLGNVPVGGGRSLGGEMYDWWAHRSAVHRLFDEIKSLALFNESPLVRQGRLSVVPLTAAQWKALIARGAA